MMALGSIIGVILLRFFSGDKVFALTSAVAVAMLGVIFSFYMMAYNSIASLLWAYFLAVSIASAVPDTALMEIAKIRFSEGALSFGLFFEIIPIAVLQYKQRGAFFVTEVDRFENNTFLPLIVASIVILVVTSLIYQLHMPPTLNKSLLQIQNELLKFKKYFAFNFDESVKAAPRRSSDNNPYIVNENVNVFDDHEKNILTTAPPPNDYSEVMEKQPDPPVPKDENYDYSKEVSKPPAIIPRVRMAKTNFYNN